LMAYSLSTFHLPRDDSRKVGVPVDHGAQGERLPCIHDCLATSR
jgi:hypothetical protein